MDGRIRTLLRALPLFPFAIAINAGTPASDTSTDVLAGQWSVVGLPAAENYNVLIKPAAQGQWLVSLPSDLRQSMEKDVLVKPSGQSRYESTNVNDGRLVLTLSSPGHAHMEISRGSKNGSAKFEFDIVQLKR